MIPEIYNKESLLAVMEHLQEFLFTAENICKLHSPEEALITAARHKITHIRMVIESNLEVNERRE